MMVGPLLLLKMLHCKRIRTNDYGEGSQDNNSEIKIKNEFSNDQTAATHHAKRARLRPNCGKWSALQVQDDQTCRICLKDGRLPIFVDSATELRESIYEIGGVEVYADDPYPKYLCQSCHALLRGAMLFRKTAQTSDNLLKKQKVVKKYEIISDLYKDDNIDVDDVPIQHTEQTVKTPKSRVCKRCDLQFSTFQEYSNHLSSPEHENKKMTCDICKNSYCSQYFKQHLCLGKTSAKGICDICGKEFAAKFLPKHRLTHFYDLPYQCTHCPYRGRFPESLKMHMRTHTGEKPYRCELCPARTFIKKSNLNVHMLTHKGKHDFNCEVCGRGFYLKRKLELHLKVDHTGLKEHICRTCGKAFGYRKQMTKHERDVHKREKMKPGRVPIYLQVETMKEQNAVTAKT